MQVCNPSRVFQDNFGFRLITSRILTAAIIRIQTTNKWGFQEAKPQDLGCGVRLKQA